MKSGANLIRVLTAVCCVWLTTTACSETPTAPVPEAAGAVVINEVTCSPTEGADWVELFNPTATEVDLGRFTLVDDNPDHQPIALSGLVLPGGGFVVIHAGDAAPPAAVVLPFGLGKGDAVTLAFGGTVVDTLDWNDGDAPEGSSWGRLPDGSGTAIRLAPTPGATNRRAGDPPPEADPFPQGRVIEIRIILPQASWEAIKADPEAGELQRAELLYDGDRVADIAVRAKGNSSLRSLVRQRSDRYSLKLDINHFVPGQRLRGLKKFNLNNGFKDASFLRETVAYELLRGTGLPASRTALADVWIADEHLGLYTVVEQVDNLFLKRHFDDSAGNLYKPDPPAGNLRYQGDDPARYRGMNLKTNEDSPDHSRFIALLQALDSGDDDAIAASLDIDQALRGLAANVALVNLDSYLGMGHNFYLYDHNGRFVIVPWDLNEAYGNFTCGCDRNGLYNLRIDEPTCGSLDERPLIARLLENSGWRAQYHDEIRRLLDGGFDYEAMRQRVTELADLIRPFVERDERKFFSIAEFEVAVGSATASRHRGGLPLGEFVFERAERLRRQLDGRDPAVADGSGSCNGRPGGGGNPCGDGVCDQAERNNPELCPQDCP
jgi:spore coat protein CotH